MFTSRNLQHLRVGLMLLLGSLAPLAPMAAAAQDSGTGETKLGEDPFTVMMKWRPAKEAPAMPDFVRQTRPAEEQLGYTPLTDKEPPRPSRKTPAELAATVGKMDAAAARARAASGFKVPKPAPRKPAPPAAEEE
jgi:hypothetical protein